MLVCGARRCGDLGKRVGVSSSSSNVEPCVEGYLQGSLVCCSVVLEEPLGDATKGFLDRSPRVRSSRLRIHVAVVAMQMVFVDVVVIVVIDYVVCIGA